MTHQKKGYYFGYMVCIKAVTGAHRRRTDWPVVQRRTKKTKGIGRIMA